MGEAGGGGLRPSRGRAARSRPFWILDFGFWIDPQVTRFPLDVRPPIADFRSPISRR